MIVVFCDRGYSTAPIICPEIQSSSRRGAGNGQIHRARSADDFGSGSTVLACHIQRRIQWHCLNGESNVHYSSSSVYKTCCDSNIYRQCWVDPRPFRPLNKLLLVDKEVLFTIAISSNTRLRPVCYNSPEGILPTRL